MSGLKILKGIFVKSLESLDKKKEERKKENDSFCTSLSRDDQIPTCTKLVNINYQFYGFSDDIIETIN